MILWIADEILRHDRISTPNLHLIAVNFTRANERTFEKNGSRKARKQSRSPPLVGYAQISTETVRRVVTRPLRPNRRV
ncbi:hypothetical protein [uncultured Campylobacter sp.]|uniref:hypothetical protein n=1 Tax=uncultured Campylobacter sp. TaxID=218934 RepID=UPI00261EEFD0|nr:hypothetical protein [uncultured Campylobacter sp.]